MMNCPDSIRISSSVTPSVNAMRVRGHRRVRGLGLSDELSLRRNTGQRRSPGLREGASGSRTGSGINASGIFVDSGVALVQFAPSFGPMACSFEFDGVRGHNFLPGAVKGGVQVDPGDQPVPGFLARGARRNGRRAGSGSAGWCRHGNPGVAAGARRFPAWACVPSGGVPCTRGRSASETPRARSRRAGPSDRRWWAVRERAAVMASNAISIQHRLHFPFEGEPTGRAIPGLDDRGLAAKGEGTALESRGRVLGFMTTDAREHLAGHGGQPTAHQGQRFAVRRPAVGWQSGVQAGTRKWADPSGSTGTVPRIRFTSQGPSKPTRSGSPPKPWNVNS